jgi:hypothetical protein
VTTATAAAKSDLFIFNLLATKWIVESDIETARDIKTARIVLAPRVVKKGAPGSRRQAPPRSMRSPGRETALLTRVVLFLTDRFSLATVVNEVTGARSEWRD